MSDNLPINIHVKVPAELELGVYANFVGVWHSAFDFTLDFAVVGQATDPGDGTGRSVSAPVAARVKVPTTVIFNLAKAIADNVRMYEEKFGPITPLSSDNGPLYPPGESDR